MQTDKIAGGNRFAVVTRGHEMLRMVTRSREKRMVTPRDKLKGRQVTFLVRDVHHPQPATILHELHADEQLFGTVLDFSHDARSKDAAFAIVKVLGVREPCIVSVDSIKSVRRAKRAAVRR